MMTIAGCIGCNQKVLTSEVDPKVSTLSQVIYVQDIHSSHSCSPGTLPPQPIDSYNALPASHELKKAENAWVGTQTAQDATCNSFRKDLYRAVFSYDLSTLNQLNGLITKAELSFFIKVMPQAPPCVPMTGGGGTFFFLPIRTVLPQNHFEVISPTNQFIRGVDRFNLNTPRTTWAAGEIVPGVTTTATGLGGASWSVDVTRQLMNSMENGDQSISFMLSGNDETRPLDRETPPPSIDCRTIFTIKKLIITHL